MTIFWKNFQKVLLTNVSWNFFSIVNDKFFPQKKTTTLLHGMCNSKLKCQIPLFFWVKERAKFLSLWSSTLVSWTQSFCLGFLNFDFWKVQLLTLYYLILLYSSRGASTHGRCPWNLFEDTKGDLPLCLSRKIQIETLPL